MSLSGDVFIMHKVKIMDVNKGQIQEKKYLKQSYKIIKINDSLFEIGIRKGLIEKNNDEYYFIGDYEELIAFKKGN